MRVEGKLRKCGFANDVQTRLDIAFRQRAGVIDGRGISKSPGAVGCREAGEINICLDERRNTLERTIWQSLASLLTSKIDVDLFYGIQLGIQFLNAIENNLQEFPGRYLAFADQFRQSHRIVVIKLIQGL